jgi:hypothetical protein
MVDADNCRLIVGKGLDQPFGEAAAGPVFPGRCHPHDFDRRRNALRHVYP